MNTEPNGLRNITISTARWLTNKNGLQGTVIFAIQDGMFKAVSYGADTKKCRQLARFIDTVSDLIEAGTINVSEFEPDDELSPYVTQESEY
jgi:hypothetical protein